MHADPGRVAPFEGLVGCCVDPVLGLQRYRAKPWSERVAAEEAANAPVPEPPTEAPPEEGAPGEASEEAPVEAPEEAPEGEENAPENVWGTGGGE